RFVPVDPLSDEQREIRDLVRDLARERIAPRAAEIDKSAEFPWDVVELFRENEIFGILFDEEYGGIGASALMALVAIEEVSKVCATSGLIIAVQELGSLGLKLSGSDQQKERYLPQLASGEWLAASPRRTCSARRETASRSPCASSTGRVPGSARRGSGSPRALPTTRSSTRSRARRWASRSESTS